MIHRFYKLPAAFVGLQEFFEWFGGLVVHDIESVAVALYSEIIDNCFILQVFKNKSLNVVGATVTCNKEILVSIERKHG